jgi:ABC-type polysaccharide/polyol phosphate export permease
MRVRMQDWPQVLRIVLAFGWSDFMRKYRGSVLGYLWSLAAPAVQFVVIFGIFRSVIGVTVDRYPLYLFLGMILWEHFALTTTACILVPRMKAPVFHMVNVPRIIFIFAAGWTHVLILLTRLLLFCVAAWWWGTLTWTGLLYIPLLLLQCSLLALGLGMMLSAYGLRFRDIEHLWTVVLQILYWLTPILYAPLRTGTLTQELLGSMAGSVAAADILALVVKLQPLSVVLFDARRALVFSPASFPSFLHVAGLTAVLACVFVAGSIAYVRRSKYFLQEY